MRILGLSTSSNTGTDHESWGSSAAILLAILNDLKGLGHDVKCINAADLHIVGNLSCYANGDTGCASLDAGPYRCWAHWNSLQDPDQYGGEDQMPVVYDGIEWADIVLVATSVRWGSHTAILQAVIERLNTLENRHSVYGEPNPLSGKKLGVIVTGQHWLTQRVAEQLLDALGQMGFDAPRTAMFTWQRTNNMRLEQKGPNRPLAESYLASLAGRQQLGSFLQEVIG